MTETEEKKLARLIKKREQQKRYRQENAEKIREQNRKHNAEWAARNPDRVKELNRAKALRHYYRNQERIREEMRKRAKYRYANKSISERRRQNLKSLYGMTPEQWEERFTSQGRVCASCGTDDPGTRGWMTDHCHTKGHVRGILCHHCNAGLGHARDNPETLRAWIAYLERTA